MSDILKDNNNTFYGLLTRELSRTNRIVLGITLMRDGNEIPLQHLRAYNKAFDDSAFLSLLFINMIGNMAGMLESQKLKNDLKLDWLTFKD